MLIFEKQGRLKINSLSFHFLESMESHYSNLLLLEAWLTDSSSCHCLGFLPCLPWNHASCFFWLSPNQQVKRVRVPVETQLSCYQHGETAHPDDNFDTMTLWIDLPLSFSHPCRFKNKKATPSRKHKIYKTNMFAFQLKTSGSQLEGNTPASMRTFF